MDTERVHPREKQKQVMSRLLQLYKDMPFLWDKQHQDYRNSVMRKKGNNVLFEVFKEFDSFGSMKTMIRKLQNMKAVYQKELRKVIESRQNGDDEVYVPTVWYFEPMSFLPMRTVMESSHSSRSTVETQYLSSSASETESIQRSESASTPLQQKKKRVTQASLPQKQESNTETAGYLLNLKEEEWEVIGKSIGLQLKDLNKKQFFIAQKIIHDTLYYGQMGLLTQHSSVTGTMNRNSDDEEDNEFKLVLV